MEKPPPLNPNYYQNDPPPPYTAGPPPPPPRAGTAYIHSTTGSTTYVHHIPASSNYGTVPIIVQPTIATDVILVGGCPVCRVGVLSEDFTLPGLCCALWFFPIGILCCLAMRERTCSNCGARFS